MDGFHRRKRQRSDGGVNSDVKRKKQDGCIWWQWREVHEGHSKTEKCRDVEQLIHNIQEDMDNDISCYQTGIVALDELKCGVLQRVATRRHPRDRKFFPIPFDGFESRVYGGNSGQLPVGHTKYEDEYSDMKEEDEYSDMEEEEEEKKEEEKKEEAQRLPLPTMPDDWRVFSVSIDDELVSELMFGGAAVNDMDANQVVDADKLFDNVVNMWWDLHNGEYSSPP